MQLQIPELKCWNESHEGKISSWNFGHLGRSSLRTGPLSFAVENSYHDLVFSAFLYFVYACPAKLMVISISPLIGKFHFISVHFHAWNIPMYIYSFLRSLLLNLTSLADDSNSQCAQAFTLSVYRTLNRLMVKGPCLWYPLSTLSRRITRATRFVLDFYKAFVTCNRGFYQLD